MKVKVFKENSYDVLETKINHWLDMNNLSKADIINFSSSSGGSNGVIYTTVVILYYPHV